MIRRATSLIAALATAAILSGCSGDSTTPVTGTVTYDGQPVANGVITFTPADGRGPTDGAPITNGKYVLELHKPGDKFVLIEAIEAPSGPVTQEAGYEKGKKATKPTVLIPPNASGNNQKITVKGGETALDFTLTSTLIKGSGG